MQVENDGHVYQRIQIENEGHIPIKRASHVLCDNESAVLSISLPLSTLNKKHNATAYHWVREAVAADIVKVSYIAGA